MDADFSIANTTKLCRNSSVTIANESINATKFSWDFCQEDFTENPASSSSVIAAGFANGYGYKLVEDNGVWFGFVVSRSLNKLYRLDFGADPTSAPSINDLGNPGNLLASPEGIDLFKDGSDWYAFIGKGENTSGQVVRLFFGTSLTNLPTATGLGTFGLGSVRIRDLQIVRQNTSIVLLALIYNTNAINRINFGSSLSNAPAANNLVTIANASLPRGFTVVHHCDPWILHMVSENGTVQQLTFGNNILGAVTLQGSYTFPSVLLPWKITSIYNGGRYYALISCNNRKYAIVNFGDLSLSSAPQEVTNNNDIRLIGLDAIKYKGKMLVQGVGVSNTLLTVSYTRPCSASSEYQQGMQPAPYTYSSAGKYTIDLTAYDADGVPHHASKTITVLGFDAPTIQIMQDGLCRNNVVGFSVDNPADMTAWSWDFGNGTTATGIMASTLYGTAGDYVVTLEAENSNCITSKIREVKIYAPPLPGFILPSGLLCTNNEFTFSNSTTDNFDGNLSYQWYVDDLPVSTDRDLQYNFSTTGARTIKLQTSIPGCSDEIEQTTSDVKAGPVVDFSFAGKCEDAEVQFVDNIEEPVTSYSWDFQNGSPSSQDDPVHVFDAPGIYQVTLTALSPNGCNNAATKPVTIYTAPAVDFSVNPPPKSCSGSLTPFTDLTPDPTDGDIATWQWDFGDPGSANNQSPLINPGHTFANAGTYDVSLTVQTDQGCASSTVKNIAIVPSPAATIENTPTCKGLPVNFLASGANISGYYWEVGTVYYEVPNPTHTFNAAGNFPMRLTVTGTNSCQTVYNKIINVPVPLTADFSVTKNCVGSEALFTDLTTGADPVVRRSWDFGGEGTGSGASPVFQFNATGNKLITLQVVSQAGCQYTTAKTIQVSSPPVADFTSLPEPGAATLPMQFTNASTGAIAYSWTFGDGSGTSTLPSPAYSFSTEGEYTVELTAIGAQGCEDRQAKTVTVVTPLPDVDLKLITVTENADGTLKIIVTIHNKGNTLVTALPVVIDISGETTLTETLKEPVLPASQYNLVLNYGINVNDDLKFLCASIELPNDLTPEDNRICKELGGQVSLFTAYPNPAVSTLKIGWVAPGNEVVAIVLVDSFGKKVLERAVSSTEGLNTAVLDVSRFRDGIYFLVLNGGSVRSAQRILISGQN